MVSSDNNKIVALKNQIISKISNLISVHNSDLSAHSNIKSTSITNDTGSTTKCTTVKAVEDYAEPKKEIGTFTELETLINNASAGDTIVLEKDYKNTENLRKNFVITKKIHINGKGHLIDYNNAGYGFVFTVPNSIIENCIIEGGATNNMPPFLLYANNCSFINIIYRNSNGLNAPFIFVNSQANSIIKNCYFYNNIKATPTNSYIIQLLGSNCYIEDCIFFNNDVGSTIWADSNNMINSCIFLNNITSYGAIHANNDTIINCIFENNTTSNPYSDVGGAITGSSSSKIINSKFLTNTDTIYPSTIVQKEYLTEHQSLSNYVQKSLTAGLLKNDGTVDTNTYVDNETLSDVYDDIGLKADKSNGVSQITDNNSGNYNNIGSLSANANQQTINSAINTAIGNLTNIELAEVVSSLPTASSNTMNKLYLVIKTSGNTNDLYNIYITVQNGTGSSATYSWEKIDDFDLQNLSIAWNDVTDKPTSFRPTSHTSTTTEYGVATDTNYGHVKIGHNFAQNSEDTALSTYGANTLYLTIDNMVTLLNELKADNKHDSPDTTYGVGVADKYGHVKIQDDLTSSSFVQGVSLSAHQGYVLKGLIDGLDSSKQNIGDCITSIELVPKTENNTGAIRLYYGDNNDQ